MEGDATTAPSLAEMSQGSRGRSRELTARTLESWLGERLGVASIGIDEVSVPKAGFSNETILARAQWDGPDGVANERRFVVRIEPTSHQLFTEPDAIRQARVMQGLYGKAPVPTIWLTEPDPSVLGAAFFLMDRVDGRIPSDVPSWHQRGWTTRLSVAERRTLHDGALQALVDLHGVTVDDSLACLRPAGDGTALGRYVEHVQRWYEWCAPVRIHGVDVIDAAMEHVISHRPADRADGVVWGDARVGNIIFGDDLSVAALLDWEGATTGPPEIDVAWWVMFDEFLCEAQGIQRLEGVAGRDETLARYETLGGRRLSNIVYYEILAGLVLSLINSRLADLLVSGGVVDTAFGAEIVTRITDLTAQRLATA